MIDFRKFKSPKHTLYSVELDCCQLNNNDDSIISAHAKQSYRSCHQRAVIRGKTNDNKNTNIHTTARAHRQEQRKYDQTHTRTEYITSK